MVRAALVVGLVAALYGNTLPNDFVWDDRLVALAPPPLSRLLVERTGAYYRPLVMLSFHADRALWGARPAGYHATNLFAHAAVAVLVGELAAAVGAGPGAALAAALVVAAHPVETDAVSYVSGRTDVLCALGVLVALLLWRRARRWWDAYAVASAVAFGAALLCKEAAAPMAVVWLLPGAHPARPAPRPVLVLATAACWTARFLATGGMPEVAGSLVARAPGIVMVAASYVGLLVWPWPLHVERFVSVAWPPAALAGGSLVVLAALGGLVAAARRAPAGWMLLGLVLAAYAPASGLVPVYPAIADRWLFAPEHFLYLPLLGLAPLVCGALARALPVRLRPLAAVAFGALLAAWSLVVIDRNRDWRSEAVLFRDAIVYEPPTSRIWFNLANLELAAGRLDDAVFFYEQAIARAPNDAAAHLNLGIARQRQGRLDDAERAYRRVLALEPGRDDVGRALAAIAALRHASGAAAPGGSPPPSE
ncbi:MAG TPA: tetratricopeptide repeat protein [Candidatus Limnocylindria bacterium]|nr:tetratricopeptide repeat protein [Candidatus Limnocylindria bacterium]